MTNFSDEELRQIAVDLYDGKIFCDLHFRSLDEAVNLLGVVFMPIGLGGLTHLTPEEHNDIGLVYEYFDKAGPRSINGYPSFFSCKLLTKGDTEKMLKFRAEYKKLKDGFTEPEAGAGA